MMYMVVFLIPLYYLLILYAPGAPALIHTHSLDFERLHPVDAAVEQMT